MSRYTGGVFSGSLSLHALRAAVFASAAGLTVVAQAPLPDKPVLSIVQSEPAFAALLDKARSGQADVDDFVRLRARWASEQCDRPDEQTVTALATAFKNESWAEATRLAALVLDSEFINRSLHLALADAYRALGNAERQAFHTRMAERLLEAMLKMGDGKSPETAYKVFSIQEEYVIMRALGFQWSTQALLSAEGGMFDAFSRKDNEADRLYFDIKVFMGPRAANAYLR